MKKVLTVLTVAVTMLVATNANAQLGVNAGYSSNVLFKEWVSSNNNHTFDTVAMNGFFVGVNCNLNLTGDLYMSLGAQYRYSFGSWESNSSLDANGNPILGGSTKYDYTQSVIDVPVLFNYGIHFTSSIKIAAFVGPTFTYALKGNTHETNTITVLGSTSTSESDIDWYGDHGDMTQFNIGGTIGASVTLDHLRIFAGYNHGLLDTGKDGDNYKFNVTSGNVYAGVSYVF